ncbi:MAG: hypothetical protein RBG1_1C00001G0418 [candidate division Zixibacteria bacterium RBG-1]|nr:MAG: hypothetical protein RBG1_1C00001G0418 [candidate division Zixibacteria bacterium RBG-1]OGC84774.1 MAG: hypothetical protein A2V73_05635 [candidate division Zixibacteria bacterium RBG_19FT_COMBO_42_43]
MKINLNIIIFHLVLVLLISAEAKAEEKDYGFFDLNKSVFQVRDTAQFSQSDSQKYTGLGLAFLIRLGLGHHDNLTQAESWTGPKLKTSKTYWSIHLEGGLVYKSAYLQGFASGKRPIPGTRTERGYSHSADLEENGVFLRVRLFPIASILNLTPILGYSWQLDEVARIYDPTGSNPDSLNIENRDKGPFYGAEIQYIVLRFPDQQDLRIAFSYTHENLRNDKLNKYRVEFGYFEYGFQKNLKKKNVFRFVGFLTLVIEHDRWSSGRKDWFLTPSLGGGMVH